MNISTPSARSCAVFQRFSFIFHTALLTLLLCLAWPGASALAQNAVDAEEHEEESGEEIMAREQFYYMRRAGGPGKVIPRSGYTSAIEDVSRLEASTTKMRSIFAGTSWISRNPNGMFYQRTNANYIAGRTNYMAFDPSDPNTIYSAAAGGGVWKTVNGGTNWTPLTDGLTTVTSGAVAVHPTNPSIVFYASGEMNFSFDSYYGDGVFKSVDAGASWTKVATTSVGSYLTQITFNPVTPSTMYVSGSGGVYRSTNGGSTWASTSAGSNANCILIDPSNPQILYTAVGGAGSNQIKKSTNGGTSWTALGGGLPTSNFGRTVLAISPSDPMILYASIAKTSDYSLRGLYRTTDGGTTWTLQNSTTNYLGSQGWYDNSIGVHPTNANIVVVGGLDVYVSTDGGVTLTQKTSWFTTSSSNMSHADIHYLGYNGTVLYCGSDGGVYKSTNDGNAWSDLNATLSTLQYQSADYDPTNPQKLYGGCQDNNLQTSTNNGATWIQRETGDGGYSVVDPVSPNIVYGQYVNGSLKRSLNSGVSFSEISPSGSTGGLFYNPYEMAPGDHNTIVFGQSDVWKTTSATTATTGSGWTQIASTGTVSGNVSAIGISSTDINKIYIGTDNGKILVTSDNGANWTTTTGFPYVSDFAVDPTDDNTAYASFAGFSSSFHVYKTTNGGTTWSSITGPHPNIPVNSIVLRTVSPRAIFTGTDLGVFMSTNEGASWNSFNEGLPPSQVFDLKYKEGPAILLAATHGRGIFTYQLGSAGFAVVPPAIGFGPVAVGSSAIDSVTVTNNDFGTLAISSAVSDNPQFGVSPALGSIPPFGSAKFTITYSPLSLGSVAGSILFTHNGITSPDTVTVTGTGMTSPPSGGTFTVIPPTGVAQITPFTFQCAGWSDPDLPISYQFAYRVGTGPMVFLGPPGPSASAMSMLPVGFPPSYSVTAYSFVSDNLGAVAVESTSVVVTPIRTYSDDTVSLGPIQVSPGGTNSVTGNLIIHNSWTSSLTLTGASTDNAAYSLSPSSGTIAPGDSLVVGVTFTPLTAGMYTGSIIFSYSDGGDDTIPLSGIGITALTVRKLRDLDGSIVTLADQVPLEWGLSVYRDSVSGASLIESSDGPVLQLELLYEGTYIIEEADSGAAWVRLGGGNRFDTISVGPIALEDTFVNFKPNHLTITAYSDDDGDFDTPGDRSFREWYLEIRRDSAAGPVVAAADGTPLVANFLGDGTYYAVIADSAGWSHLGYTVDGVPTEDSVNAVELDLSDGENVVVHFINASPTSSKLYRSGSYEQWATAIDLKGKLKSLPKKANKVEFRFRAVAPALVPSASLKVKTGMVSSGVIYRGAGTTDTVHTWSATKEALFSGAIALGETLEVYGWGTKGKPVKVQLEWGTAPKVTKSVVAAYLTNQPRLPMPNLHNVGEELFAVNAFPGGLVVGRPQGVKGASSVLHLKYKDVQKTMNKKGILHDDVPRCLDVFDANLKPIAKQQKGLPPDKHNNSLLAQLLTLKLNVAASVYNRFPSGLGQLTYNDEANPVDPMNGLVVDSIIAIADRVISCGIEILSGDTLTPDDVYDAIEGVNGAFADENIDTVSFSTFTMMTGAIRLVDVPFLHPTTGITPKSILDAPMQATSAPVMYRLNQNYPNPFNPTTTISFDLPEASTVTLTVFNMLGQEVEVLIDNEEFSAGVEDLEFDASRFPSGVYFYRLTAQEISDGGDASGDVHTLVGKMILMK
jgi:photosystem II stability/assembly factor-like uncharacterized protein